MFLKAARLCALLCTAGFIMPAVSYAQMLPGDMALPGSADSGRVLKNQQAPVAPMRDLQEEAAPRKVLPIVPAGMENLKFVLQEIDFEGMTAYKKEDVVAYYDQYLDTEISVATLFEIMAKVQQKYLDDGYALTKIVIPNQDIQGGNVKFSVIEGHVGELEISPDIRRSNVIDDAARQIAAMRPLNVRKLERIMLVLNALPDLNVSAVLANPVQPLEPGSVRLILQKNEDRESIGSVSLDNHGSIFTGPLQARGTVRGFHVGPNYSELSVSGLATTQFKEQKLGVANYSVPVFGASGSVLSFTASTALTEPGSSLEALDLKGKSQSLAAEISYPVIMQRAMTLKVNTGFEWKNSKTDILGEELYDDRLRILKAGVNFNFMDSFAGYNVLDLQYAQGLNIFGAREPGSVDLSRQDGRSDFKKFELQAGRIQALPGNFELFGLIAGQYSYDPLLSSEEFGFGGGQIGRGYDASEITGDRGISATLEMRYRTNARAFNTVLALQPYAFYDIGKIWNIDAGAKDKISAASAGVGLRINLDNAWDMDFNLAKPLTKSADNEPKYENDLGARALFSISHSF